MQDSADGDSTVETCVHTPRSASSVQHPGRVRQPQRRELVNTSRPAIAQSSSLHPRPRVLRGRAAGRPRCALVCRRRSRHRRRGPSPRQRAVRLRSTGWGRRCRHPERRASGCVADANRYDGQRGTGGVPARLAERDGREVDADDRRLVEPVAGADVGEPPPRAWPRVRLVEVEAPCELTRLYPTSVHSARRRLRSARRRAAGSMAAASMCDKVA